MEDMKGDMSGGAAVIEGVGAVADLGIPLRVLAVVASTENMAGGGAYRPGDILTAMNGKTIEVINTDAEGRLVLADALWYARDQGATHLVDLATLTGAIVLAMGDLYAGVYANDDELARPDRRRRRTQRRPPLAAAAAPPLPPLRELELRRHEERLDPQGGLPRARRRVPPRVRRRRAVGAHRPRRAGVHPPLARRLPDASRGVPATACA